MRRVHPPTRCQAGTRLLHPWLPSKLARSSPVSHAGSKGSNILLSSPPMQPCSPTPLETRTPPGVLRVGCGTVNPPSNIENDAIQLISKNSKKISHQSNRICGLIINVYQYVDRPLERKSPQEWIHSPLPECPSSGSAGRTIDLIWFVCRKIVSVSVNLRVWLEER